MYGTGLLTPWAPPPWDKTLNTACHHHAISFRTVCLNVKNNWGKKVDIKGFFYFHFYYLSYLLDNRAICFWNCSTHNALSFPLLTVLIQFLQVMRINWMLVSQKSKYARCFVKPLIIVATCFIMFLNKEASEVFSILLDFPTLWMDQHF